jgi:aminopeptidase
MNDGTLERMAALLVDYGANIQPGQIVIIGSDLGKEPLTRAVARRCYQAGAHFVDVMYADRHLMRARIVYGSDEAIGHEPAWTVSMPREVGEQRGATIGIAGPVDTDLLTGLDPDRLRRDRPPGGREWLRVGMGGMINWTVGACPTPEWATLVHPGLEPEEALRKLWEQVEYACRLDADDPIAAWTARGRELLATCERLTEARFDALHFGGPGTDLTIGLLPSSTWLGAEEQTADGLRFRPNLPTEEVFTTPDPLRVDGVVASTRPLELGGTIVRDLVVRFESGRAVSIEASEGADMLRAQAARDDGGTRLGEVALVDGSGRIGELDTVFYDTLYDENAASHIALGGAYPLSVGDPAERDRMNESETHIDFMIGSPEVVVTGIRADGARMPVLVGGEWAV